MVNSGIKYVWSSKYSNVKALLCGLIIYHSDRYPFATQSELFQMIKAGQQVTPAAGHPTQTRTHVW